MLTAAYSCPKVSALFPSCFWRGRPASGRGAVAPTAPQGAAGTEQPPGVRAHATFQDALSEGGFRREPTAGCEQGTSLPCASVGVNFSAHLAPRRPGTGSGAALPWESRLRTPSLPPRPPATAASGGTRLVPSPAPPAPRRCATSATWRGCRAGEAGGGGRLRPAADPAPAVASPMRFCSAKAMSGLEEAGAGAGAAEVLQSPSPAVGVAAGSAWPRAVPRCPCLQEPGAGYGFLPAPLGDPRRDSTHSQGRPCTVSVPTPCPHCSPGMF